MQLLKETSATTAGDDPLPTCTVLLRVTALPGRSAMSLDRSLVLVDQRSRGALTFITDSGVLAPASSVRVPDPVPDEHLPGSQTFTVDVHVHCPASFTRRTNDATVAPRPSCQKFRPVSMPATVAPEGLVRTALGLGRVWRWCL
mgnify:CR=1 FL=1